MSVGQNIKSRRKQLGMNAETLADKLGVSPSTIYRYESGDIGKVDSAKLIPIAEALQTTPGYLMGWETEEVGEKLRSIGKQLTAQASGLSDIEFALYGVTHELSENGKMDLLQFARFIHEQETKAKAAHDD